MNTFSTTRGRLMLGDAFTLLRELGDKSVDVTISDPPYSDHVEHGQAVSGRRTGQAVVRKKQIGVGALGECHVALLCGDLVRVTRRWIVLFCAWEQITEYKNAIEDAGGRWVRTCAWDKPDGTPQLTGDRPATWGECLIVAYANRKDALHWNGGGKRGVYRYGVCRGDQRGDHPTQKPYRLMLEIVGDFTDPDDTVLDPFLGSGTTAVACAHTDRNYLGFEINPKFFEIACQRVVGGPPSTIDEHQLDLFGKGATDALSATT